MDKITKIKAEIERLRKNLPWGGCAAQLSMECNCKNEAYTEIEKFINSLPEEPVSEDLEEASKEWLSPQLDKSYAAYGETKQMELTHFDGYAILDAIEFGAKWQKNSVWHSGKEEPKIDAKILVVPLTSDAFGGQYNGNGIIVSSRDHEITLRPTSKWCYLKDVLPNKED